MATTFTKLRDGSWGIRVPSDAIRSGAQISVTKKDGSTQSVVVDQVIWSGKDRSGGNVSLCSILPNYRSARRSTGRNSYGQYASGYCYHPCPVTDRKCCPENGPCHDCE